MLLLLIPESRWGNLLLRGSPSRRSIRCPRVIDCRIVIVQLLAFDRFLILWRRRYLLVPPALRLINMVFACERVVLRGCPGLRHLLRAQTKHFPLGRKLLAPSVTTAVRIFVSSWEVSDAVVASPGYNSLVDSRVFVRRTWRGIVFLDLLRAAGIDSLIIQNRNVCLVFCLFDCFLLHSTRGLAMVHVADAARDSSGEEDDFFGRGGSNRGNSWRHPVWCPTGVNVLILLRPLTSATFNSRPADVRDHDRWVLRGDWLALFLSRCLVLDQGHVHRVCRLPSLSIGIVVALTALASVLLRNDRVVVAVGRNVLGLDLSFIASLLRPALVVVPFDRRRRLRRSLYFGVHILLVQVEWVANCGHLGLRWLVTFVFNGGRPHLSSNLCKLYVSLYFDLYFIKQF